MRCSDTVLAFAVFFIFGSIVAVWPAGFRDMQVFVRSRVPWGNRVPFGSIMQKSWYLKLIRVEGILLMVFGLFLLQWHLRHCG
jgi:hypothetical protein